MRISDWSSDVCSSDLQGAACRPAIEKGLLIDFLGPIRVADESDLNMTVAAGEEQVQQCVEALGAVLHMLAHGTRHVHQSDHDSLRDGLGWMLIATIAKIDVLDLGIQPTAAIQQIALLPRSEE